MNRLTTVSVLALLSLPALAQQPSAAPSATQVRVGTWNIENLGHRREARGDADYARLAAYVAELGVDVLAVQEINGAAPLERLCGELGPDWRFVVGTSGGIGRGEQRWQIAVGFVFNAARVELLEARELNDLPRRADALSIFHRVPVMASFRARSGGLDFRAVVVHFKAGRLDVSERSPQDSAKRQAEVGELGGWLDALLAREGEDQDLMLLGDCNADPWYPAWQALAARLEPLRPAHDHHRSIVYFDEQIDHVFVSKGLREEVVKDSLRVRSERYAALGGDAWKRDYSDHMPLVVDLDASRDRDPEARFSPAPADQRLPEQGTPRVYLDTPGRRWF